MFLEVIKKVENHLARNLPFVIYRKPHEDEVTAIFQKDAELNHVTDFSETGFVFAPFNSDIPSILLQPHEVLRYTHQIEETKMVDGKVVFKTDTGAKEFHINLVKEGIKEIARGAYKKVVLSRKLLVSCTTDPLKIFQNLLRYNAPAFCYLWYHPKVGMWLGATPEILLCKEQHEFTSMSLAGTLKYKEGQAPDWGEKELEEQALVTHYIVDVLDGLIDNLGTSQKMSVRAGNLWHLRTKISGTIRDGELKNVVRALHPTPAVCGIPMSATRSFIKDNEGYNREFYTGFLGELNFGERHSSHLYVNLRCMQLRDKNALIYVGGGVTKDSDPELEWEETVAKSATMMNALFYSEK